MNENISIFVSYSRRDVAPVTSFVESIRTRGLKVWQDISGRQSGIPYSTRWFEAIENAIHQSWGAIIVDSDNWQASRPCRTELQMIEDCEIPHVRVPVSEIEECPAEALEKVMAWIAECVDNEENYVRTDLVSKAFRYSKRKGRLSLVPRPRHLYGSINLLKRLRQLSKYVNFRFSPEESASIRTYLAHSKRSVVVRWSLIFAGLLVCAFSFNVSRLSALLRDRMTDYKYSETNDAAYISAIRRISADDPAYALYLLTDPALVDEKENEIVFKENQRYFHAQQAMLELLAESYPIEHREGSTVAQAIDEEPATASTVSVSVDYNPENGMATIEDAERGLSKTIALGDEPSCWVADESGDLVAVAVGGKVIVADLPGYTDPVTLRGNTDSVVSLRFDDDEIVASTASGDSIAWNAPFLARASNRTGRAVRLGSLAVDDADDPTAAFIADGKLVISSGGMETTIRMTAADGSPDVHASFGEHCVLSDDGTLLAVRGGGSLFVMDTATTETLLSVETSGLEPLTFSDDGTKLACADSSSNCLVEVDLQTQEARRSDGEDHSIMMAVPFNGGYLSVDALGQGHVYEENLERLDDLSIPIHQRTGMGVNGLAASESSGYAFASAYGDYKKQNLTRVDVTTGEVAYFDLETDDDMVSTTAVVLSDDESSVAFGHADGTVRIWNSETMNLVYLDRSIPEMVIDLVFSHDGQTLYALGGSGAVYELAVGSMIDAYDAENAKGTWLRYLEMGDEIIQTQKSLGLATWDAEARDKQQIALFGEEIVG